MPSHRHRWLGPLALAAALLLLFLEPTRALAGAGPADRTESPYFFVDSDDPEVDRLPLKATRVDVRIVGVIADVTVTQHYRNEGTRAIEARYVFPGSTRAAVYGMNVRLADRLLTARIREKAQARVEYDAAKREGKTAALLEQHRPNVFQMNVANILPGDDVAVELRYTELLVPTDGTYRFVFPTVVGPRYNGSPESGSGTSEKWISMPFLHQGGLSNARFDLAVELATPIPLQAVSSPSHRIEPSRISDTQTRVELAATGTNENNRDFVLDYRLAGDRIESGILLSRGDATTEGENFFLAMVEPPRVVGAAQIVPREYVFVVDVSGSMHGFPLDTAKALLEDLVGSLRPNDTFNVMLFAGGSRMLAPESVPATRANIEQALRLLRDQRGGGSTELVPALRRALALAPDRDRARTFVVVTDGYVTVERETFDLIRRNLARANLFAFGIGSSVNRHLIEGMARAGQGEPFVVLHARDAAREAERFRRMIDAPVLTHLQARFEGLDVYDVEPPLLPDVFAQRPVVLYGKWRGEPHGRLVLEGESAAGTFRARLDVAPDRVSAGFGALRYLWARQRIATLSDQEGLEGGSAYRDEILGLGLRYNLLTQYTSFIAVDQVVRNPAADGVTVDQPSPLPQGVSDLAVGGEVPSTPEPGVWWMLAIAGLAMLWRLRRLSPATGVLP
ncbi:vault protein inter-alpha-trypsin subunit [Sulfurifustis variabilis]|uniref:Vault protein inter-alpha-trypsin subunit n=1 Tax=Sulfurifustis variabilis TaxID=1675686 RepID=A0A1C7AFS6_9GAMM|nr:VIT and VWA domain-containing protein [Sulfurifustis variabilis]BAU50245.1 vault protein inter-alpha-trypsin subunit [Sulfurifustis variabilis]